ncbi:MAG: type I-B CRISPR-associated protein Cas8b1/Cst1 [Spirochaetales bacterium]|nr:type I-B CRISPR-associated protein Cas8b1/Cst1 [Spirochaetales bacterium]
MSEIIYEFTGNPFVDAGIWAISQWIGKKPKELDIEDLKMVAEDVFDTVYSHKKWYSSILHGMVFPNGKVSNPGDFKKPLSERKSKALIYYNELIEEIEPLRSSGSCISCGRRNSKKRYYKSEIPLTGSGKCQNFFSFGTDGADYCPACAFAVQFSPLIMYKCGDLLLMHSDSETLMRIWSKKAIKNLKVQFSAANVEGPFNEGYKNVKNAFFHIVGSIIDEMGIRGLSEKQVSITFYRFKNFNQGANLDVYYFPAVVFSFLTDIKRHENYDDWMRIVRRGYRYVDWEAVKEEKGYKNNPNTVYNNLLEGKSIIGFFIDRKNKEAIGGWNLLSNYLEEVRNMDEKRVETIREVADKLSEYIKASEDIKTLNKLETASNYRNYTNLLRKIIKKRIGNGAEEPLFSFDDYVNYLFPEGNLTWRETQDLILFRIYEVLHDWIVQQGISEELVVEEEEMEAENV